MTAKLVEEFIVSGQRFDLPILEKDYTDITDDQAPGPVEDDGMCFLALPVTWFCV